MKMKKYLNVLLATALAVSMAVSGCSSNSGSAVQTNEEQAVETDFAGGSGTEEDPYIIETAEQLDLVRNDLSAFYILGADIDLSDYDNWEPIGTVDMEAESPENMFDIAFIGTFDGDGHKISNVKCDIEYGVGIGLFGLSGGTVKNLEVNGAEVYGQGDSMAVGAVVGYNVGTIDGVKLSGDNTVSATNCVGGIAGGNEGGSITNCTVENAEIIVTGDNDFSGGRIIQHDVAQCGGLIVGGGFMGTVDNCTAKGTVIGEGNEPLGLGGIGGCLQSMESISGNKADVVIEAKNGHAIGGLCGYAGNGDDGTGTINEPCEITDCEINVVINADGATHVGGLVGTGLYYFGMEGAFTIEDCSVSGEINGAVTPGAAAGRAEGSTIVSCETGITADGAELTELIGQTEIMYESADQY